MRKKNCKISVIIFSVTAVFLFGFFMITTSQVFAENGYKGKDNHKQWQEQNKEYRKHQKEMEREGLKHYQEQERESRKHIEEQEREALKHGKEHDRRDYKKGYDYHGHPGYRECPSDKSRQYGYHDYRGHRYDYHGHWRSWEDWDRYAKKYPNIYEHGRYYQEEGHLMFRFCDPNTGSCFFFSIGR